MFLRGSVALLLFLSLGTLCCANQNIDNEGIFHSSLLESENVRSILFKRSPQEVNNSDVANSTISDTQDEDIPSPDNAVPRAIFSTPSIRLSSPSYTAPVGSNYIVQCSGNSNNLTWYYPDFHRIVGTQGSPRTVLDRIHNTSQLVFDAVRSEHAGHYRCVNTILRSTVGAEFVLTIQVLRPTPSPVQLITPAVRLSSGQLSALPGSHFSVKCSGNSPNLTWIDPHSRNLSTFSTTNIQVNVNRAINSSELLFNSIKLEHAGHYRCYNYIQSKYATDSFSLNVTTLQPTAPPVQLITPVVRLSSGQLSALPGSHFSVKCSGNSPNLTWIDPHSRNLSTFSTTNIQVNVNRAINSSELLFNSIKLEHAGHYRCYNYIQSKYATDSFSLNVTTLQPTAPPVQLITPVVRLSSGQLSALPGSHFSVKCSGNSPNLTWIDPHSRNLSTFSTTNIQVNVNRAINSSELLFNSIKLEHAGHYRCYNYIQSKYATDSFSLNVTTLQPTAPPVQLITPVVRLSSGQLSALPGSHFSVKCSGNSPNLTWIDPHSRNLSTFSTTNIQVNVNRAINSSELLFNSIKLEHAGHYRCYNYIQSKYATDSFSLNVTIAQLNPTVKLSSDQHAGVLGTRFSVICSGNSPNLTWTDPFSRNVSQLQNPSIRVFNNRLSNTSELIFESIAKEYEGYYSCSNNILGRSVLAQFKLSSIVPRPTVRLSPVDKKVEKYPTQKYSVICYGNSNNITWKTPNNAIVFARTPGSRDDPYTVIGNLQVELIFEDIKLYQRGVYKCSVGLSGFQETASFELAVNDIPRLELTPPVEYGTVEVKGEYRIKCEHKKVSNIQWKGPDDKIITSHSDKIQARSSSHASELIIKRAANRFSGIYTCVGQADGLSVFRPFTLSVTRRQRLSEPSFGSLKAILMQKKVGEGFNVTCEGDTNQIYWRGPPSSDVISTDYTQRIHTKNVVNVDDDEYTLELNAKNLQLGDAGSYTCQVIDGVELKDRSFKLSVIEPVHFIKDLPSQYHVVEGKDIILNCGARGYPTPVIEWYKRNSTSSLKLDALSIEHAINGDELTLKNASYKFAGTYTCNARQEIIGGNNGERSMDLKVYHKPTFPDGPNVTLYNYLGRPINIMCIVVSEPAALYTWSRNGTRIIFRSPNNFMARPFDSKNDFGNYECEATNEYGSTFQNITVLEGEKPAAPGFKIRSVNNTDIRIELTSKQNSTTHYVVEYLIKDQDKQFNNFTLAKGKTNNYILHMKKAKTKYLLRAATINNIEQSPFTKNETVITGSATVARFSLAMQLYLVIVLVAIIPYQFCY